MNEVLIDVRGLGIEEHFTTDLVSVEQLVSCIEDLDCDIRTLKETIEELKNTNDPNAYDKWRESQWI